MPLVLRKVDRVPTLDSNISKKEHLSPRYSMIGPTYTHGLLNGEGAPKPIIRDATDQEQPDINNLMAPAVQRLFSLLGLTPGNGRRIRYACPWDILDLV